MRSGQWYLPGGDEANEHHRRCFALTREFNQLGNTDPSRARELLRELFPAGAVPEIWGPVHVEYGVNTRFGEGCFLNFNCVILDIAEIIIGEGTLFGPACQLITVEHPVEDVPRRAEGWERARPITIGKHCWFGAGAMVMPGVAIDDNCVIAAGAVVTRDVPANTMVGGVPARVIRELG